MMLKLWHRLGRPQAKSFSLSLVVGAFAAAAGVGLLGLSGWFLVAAGAAGAFGAAFSFNHLYPSAGVRALAVGRVGLRYGEQLSGHAAMFGLAAHVRPAVFLGLARQSVGLRPLPQDALSVLIDDVNAVEGGFLRFVAPIVSTIAGVTTALVILAAQGGRGALVAVLLAATLAVAGAILLRFSERNAEGQRRAIADADLRDKAAELFESIEELEAYGVIGKVEETIKSASENALRLTLRAERRARLVAGLPSAVSGVVCAMVLAIGVDAHWSPAATTGAALALLAGIGALALWSGAIDALPRAQAGSSRLLALIEAVDVLHQPPDTGASVEEILPIQARAMRLSPAPKARVIGPISFDLLSCGILQILGPSGVGKSTLNDAIMRLREIDSGELYFSRRSASTLRAAAVRRRIGYCAQNPVFLAGPLRDALVYGRPDASDEEVWQTLQAVGIDSLIKALPEGLDTNLPEDGNRFSGGELRRLSLARALIIVPRLLILDEPLAGLDALAATQIVDALEAWQDRTGGALLVAGHQPVQFSKPSTQIWLS
jgi:ATP-binding cassette subfamily C protein CydC